MFGHTPIRSDRDRRVRIYVDDTAISASLAQSEYARFPNFIGDRFTAVTNTVSGIKTYDIALKYADKIIPKRGNTLVGSVPRHLDFEASHFVVSENVGNDTYRVFSTGRTIPRLGGTAAGATLAYINFDSSQFAVAALSGDNYNVTSTGRVKVNELTTIRKLNISGAGVTVTDDVPNDEIDIVVAGSTDTNDQTEIYSDGTLVGGEPRKPNFSNEFVLTDDAGNDRVNIALAASGSSGGMSGPPTKKVGGLYGGADMAFESSTSANVDVGWGIMERWLLDFEGGGNTTNECDADGANIDITTGNDNDDNIDYSSGHPRVTRGALSPSLWFKIKLPETDQLRMYIGFVASSTLVVNDDNYLNGVSGFGIRYSSTTESNWQIAHNNSAGTTQLTSTGVSVGTSVVSFRLFADPANTRWGYQVNGGTIAYVTGSEIPAMTTNLNVYHRIETKTDAAKTLKLYYTHIESE